jgi:hypothetical protein
MDNQPSQSMIRQNLVYRYFRQAVSLPPKVLATSTIDFIKQRRAAYRLRQHDKHRSSYLKKFPNPILDHYLPAVDVIYLLPMRKALQGTTAHFLAHNYNLLGSGWTHLRHGIQCRGLEGFRFGAHEAVHADSGGKWLEKKINGPNQEESKRIWRLIDDSYTAIDWQLDFKSGYRWSENTWYRDVIYGHRQGADAKVPWELSRMQHLPQLAWAYILGMDGQAGFAKPQTYISEFRNQILDFIATNPPRFGINWRCTMDVAIRIINWLVGYDTFYAAGVRFDEDFQRVFSRSIYEHGNHIINNLEWYPQLRSNHYLANIVGLLFVSAYLKQNHSNPEVDSWLAFSIQELLTEVYLQFFKDGSNFEASTAYHRLAGEMVIYATALILGLPKNKINALKTYDHRLHKVKPRLMPGPLPLQPLQNTGKLTPFPDSYFQLLEKMAEFTMHATKPDGHIHQVGDNDSGRVLKLDTPYFSMTVAEAKSRFENLTNYNELPDTDTHWEEDHLDHRSFVTLVNALFERDDFNRFAGQQSLEAFIIKSLSATSGLPSYKRMNIETAAEKIRIGAPENFMRIERPRDALAMGSHRKTKILFQHASGPKSFSAYGYPDFGLYIFRSKNFYLAVRCGTIGQNGVGGHAHNDQLAIELFMDGRDIIRDPGAYLYTPLPVRRNQYRSIAAHFAPQLAGCEPGSLDSNLFRLGNEAKARCIYFGDKGFIGVHHGFGTAVYRIVRLMPDVIEIEDYVEGNRQLVDIYNGNFKQQQAIAFSGGYGQQCA